MDVSFTLAAILTPGGVVAAGALITGIIALLKTLPDIGARIDAGLEPIFAYILAAVLVLLAYTSSRQRYVAPEFAFSAFLAWYGIAKLSGAVHDQVKGATTGRS